MTLDHNGAPMTDPDPDQPPPKLTAAQQTALEVLVQADRKVRGGKRRSSSTPVPCVNTAAAFSLCNLKLAKMSLYPRASNVTSGYEFAATDAGRAAHAQLRAALEQADEAHA